ncbi:hypothetical protein JM949_01835 [Micromonospora sp. STR1s_6]|uniref:Aminomethyltransferase n=2 Tax=Micromonospora tarensis TaxID=2806100 RepID=A0ABS1YAM7_9ACTN|nr:hypothetical protein [Micromonospora tarensis]
MTETDGWIMPLEFSGVFREYQAHRRSSVIWDASNLGSIRVSGPGALDLLQTAFTNDLRRCEVGRSQYTFLLSEVDAGIIDDLMIWRVDTELFYLTPNRPEPVLRALRQLRKHDRHPPCDIEDVSSDRVLLALQGAQARERMAELAPPAATMPALRVRRMTLAGGDALVATTRFGGQVGFELHLTPPVARTVYRTLVARGVAPAGLGMRETHRLESGIPRYGFELSTAVTPLETGSSQAVSFGTDFLGRSALLARRERGAQRLLRTIVMRTRQVPTAGSDVLAGDERIGQVTSGNFSPRLHRGIGFAFVRPEEPPGSEVTVRTQRGGVAAEIVATPIEFEAAR